MTVKEGTPCGSPSSWPCFLVGMFCVGIPHASAGIGDLQVTVKTDKGSYTSGETVLISVILTNTGTSSATLNFGSTCQASYTVEGSGRAWYSFPHVCAMALTNLTLAPGQVKVYRFSWDQKDASGNLVPSPGDFLIRGDTVNPFPQGSQRSPSVRSRSTRRRRRPSA